MISICSLLISSCTKLRVFVLRSEFVKLNVYRGCFPDKKQPISVTYKPLDSNPGALRKYFFIKQNKPNSQKSPNGRLDDLHLQLAYFKVQRTARFCLAKRDRKCNVYRGCFADVKQPISVTYKPKASSLRALRKFLSYRLITLTPGILPTGSWMVSICSLLMSRCNELRISVSQSRTEN